MGRCRHLVPGVLAVDHSLPDADYTVSLRDRIKHVIDCVEDQDDSVCMDAAADAIHASPD
jgi:hypothetical protein